MADVNKPVNRITYLDVARSIGGIKGINKVTTNRYMSYMKILFNFARKRGYITVNPLAEWQKKGEQPRRLQCIEEREGGAHSGALRATTSVCHHLIMQRS